MTAENQAFTVDRDLLAEPSPDLLALLDEQVEEGPQPLRMFDQVRMNRADAARYIQALGMHLEGKRVVFMGDSDGIALGLAAAATKSLIPPIREITLCDFDERVLDYVATNAQTFGCAVALHTIRYNVFSPLPKNITKAFDFFHTNPPYGMYNGGRSVIAFLERCIAATKPGGDGIVVLGNDPRRVWTKRVLRRVLKYLLIRQVTPIQVLQRVHRYAIDDDPELETGLIYCHAVSPDLVIASEETLPISYTERFYGRQTIDIPEYINITGTPVYKS